MTNATAAAPAAPKTAAAPAAAPKTAAAPAAATAKAPVTPKSQAPAASTTTPPKAPAAKPAAKAKPQTKAKAPPQTPAGDKAEASAKAAVGKAMDNSAAANKHNTTANTTANTTTTKPNVPAGAQGNSKADRDAKRGKGDNSRITMDEIDKVAQGVAENLAGVMNADGRIEKAKGQAETLRKEAAGQLFPVFDRMGLDPDWGKDFAAKAKEFDEYNELQQQVCEQLSKRVRDKIEYTSKGKPIFSGRVKKAWSRLNTSYKEGGDGGQTKADSSAREAAKQRTKTNTAKAEMMDHLILAHKEGNNEKVETLLKSAAGQWGKALGV